MLPILCQTIESFFASLFFAILFGVRRRDLVCTAGAGAVCWFVYAVVTAVVGEIPAYFLSAVATTIYCEIFARLLRTPTIVYLAAGVIPLVPGGGIYRTMLLCIQGTPEQALSACINTVSIAGAMAMGIMVVSSLFRVLSHCKKANEIT
ncbi:MAG: threonine/serine exporter family protein [Butyricicoccus pullicaecorum]|nr:threonine/serine exporter family protein [Butyricicoccus pullicaecorum]